MPPHWYDDEDDGVYFPSSPETNPTDVDSLDEYLHDLDEMGISYEDAMGLSRRSPSPYIADDSSSLASDFENLSLSSSSDSESFGLPVYQNCECEPLKGIIYKMDRENERAMVRVMTQQDTCDAQFIASKNYDKVDINHLYLRYKYLEERFADLEIGSIIEILKYEGHEELSIAISEAHEFSHMLPARITKYSIGSESTVRLTDQLVAITRVQDHCIRVVGSKFGSFESIVAFPRTADPAEYRKYYEPHSFIYGDIIHLPKYYKVILMDGFPELVFDHDARLATIVQYENFMKGTAPAALDKSTATAGRPFLTNIRKLRDSETDTILQQTRNLDAVSYEEAVQYVRDPLLALAALEDYVARESVKQFTCEVTNIDFEEDKLFGGDVIYVPLTDQVKKCMDDRGRQTWHLGADLVLSNKTYLMGSGIPVMLERTNVERKGGKYIRLIGGLGSKHVFDAIGKHRGNLNWGKVIFKLGPLDNHMNSNADAIRVGFEKFFKERYHLFQAFVGRSTAPNVAIIHKLYEDFYISGQKLDTSQRLAMRTALGVPGFTCVSAPPGSGKTFMISGIVAARLQEEPNARFAISATTNVAVTNAIETVHSKFPNEKTVRQFSRKAEAELAKNSGVLDISLKRLTRNPEVVNKLMSNKDFAKAVAARDAAHEQMKQRASNVVEQLSYVENYRSAEGSVGVKFIEYYGPKIFGTTGSIMARSDHKGITHLIVDEAAQMSQIDALSLYCRLPDLQYITLVGDSRQLGPFTDLQKNSLAHKIMKVGELTRLEQLKSSAKRELQYIYRCHPKIIDLLLKPIYGQQLQSGTPASQRSLAIDRDLPRAADGSPVLFVQLDGDEGRGCRNKKEVQVVLDFLRELKAKGIKPEEISIICHHRAQKDKLCQKLKNKGNIGRLNLLYPVNTVDSYQGKEAKVVLILTTKTSKSSNLKELQHTFQFISEAHRETVAVSRAQHAIYLFGNWSQVAVMPFWNQFGEGLIKSGAFVNEHWKPISDPGWKTGRRN